MPAYMPVGAPCRAVGASTRLRRTASPPAPCSARGSWVLSAGPTARGTVHRSSLPTSRWGCLVLPCADRWRARGLGLKGHDQCRERAAHGVATCLRTRAPQHPRCQRPKLDRWIACLAAQLARSPGCDRTRPRTPHPNPNPIPPTPCPAPQRWTAGFCASEREAVLHAAGFLLWPYTTAVSGELGPPGTRQRAQPRRPALPAAHARAAWETGGT